MTKIERLIQGQPPEIRAAMAPVLRQIVHDLNGPLSTFSVEFYTAGSLLQRLLQAVQKGDTVELGRWCEALESLRRNVEKGNHDLVAYVEALDRIAEQEPTPEKLENGVRTINGRHEEALDQQPAGEPGFRKPYANRPLV